jgi:hypothetical protein
MFLKIYIMRLASIASLWVATVTQKGDSQPQDIQWGHDHDHSDRINDILYRVTKKILDERHLNITKSVPHKKMSKEKWK